VFVCPGNHDVYANWPAVRARLAELPLTVLVNESRTVVHRGTPLVVVGTGDPAGGRGGAGGGRAGRGRGAAGVDDDAAVLALAHNPALWPQLFARGVMLTLSRPHPLGAARRPEPRLEPRVAVNTYAMGAYREGRALLYVHPGTNYWGIPFRLGARPEVAVVRAAPRRRRAVAAAARRVGARARALGPTAAADRADVADEARCALSASA
jgi:predicted MPP superfamily phosphohydrolase